MATAKKKKTRKPRKKTEPTPKELARNKALAASYPATSKQEFVETRKALDEALERLPDSQVAPTDIAERMQSLREACESEGISLELLAKKLKLNLEATQVKWDRKKREFVEFIDWEQRRRAIEMGIKAFGGYEKRPDVSINVNVDLESILRDPLLTPEQKRDMIADFRSKTISLPQSSVEEVVVEND